MPWGNKSSWSDPSGGGVDPAAVTARYQYPRQYRSPLQGLNYKDQFGAATQQALGDIAKIMQQRKQQQIALALSNAGAPPIDAQKYAAAGLPLDQAMKQWQADKVNKAQQEGQQGEDWRLTHAIKQAQLDKLNAPDTRVPVTAGGQTFNVEPEQALSFLGRNTAKADPWSNSMIVAKEKQGLVTDPTTGKPIPGYVGANDGDYYKLVDEKGYVAHVPIASYNARMGTGQPQSATQQPQGGTVVKTQEDFDALPSGAVYTGSDGQQYKKP